MENSTTSSVDESPESWEVADVDASLRRLMIARTDSNSSYNNDVGGGDDDNHGNGGQPEISANSGSGRSNGSGISEALINTVDQFLREAIQNPRERVSVLRMEQDIIKFIRDRTRDEMEFQQLPTSYLRLAAHRLAQHYSLQSLVLLDTYNNMSDGSGSRIILRKTSNLRLPLVRLADIPVNLPTDESGPIKVAIKQRPQKGTHSSSNSINNVKTNSSKSVEERKEEYDRARARIFSLDSSVGSSSGKTENRIKTWDNLPRGPRGTTKKEDKVFHGGSDAVISRSMSDSSVASGRLTRSMVEKEPTGRPKNNNNKVAIFRDREVERHDPDYDRSYDRYMQRFDPGFGFSAVPVPYAVQPMYAPAAINYNTEFPQLGSSHRPSSSIEHHPLPIPQHLSGPWVAPSAPTGIGYAPSETVLSPFSTDLASAHHPTSGLYLPSAQYPFQPQPGRP